MKKHKTIKNVIIILLAVVMLCNFLGCNCNKEDDSTSGTTPSGSYSNPNHVFNYKDTNVYMTYKGRTNYRLVVPKDASDDIVTAKNEFTALFKYATGVELKTVVDENLTHNAQNYYFSLGDTSLYASSGLNVDKTALKYEGTRIITKDKTVYIVGGGDAGVLNGVYTFMEINFNFDTYTKQVTRIDKAENSKLLLLDVTDIPDIDYRMNSLDIMWKTSTDYDENNYSNRLRNHKCSQVPIYLDYCDNAAEYTANPELAAIYGDYLNVDSRFTYYKYGVHNVASHLLPILKWRNQHPKWYSTKSPNNDNGLNSQLCYTCRGDEQEQEAMIEEILKKYIYSIEHCPDNIYKDCRSIAFGMNDNHNFCDCDECRRVAAEYKDENGASIKTAPAILVLNKVAKRLGEWMETQKGTKHYKADFKVYFTAYYDYSISPAVLDKSTGEYKAIKDDMKLNDYAACYLCYIDINYQKSVFDADTVKFVNQSKAWKALTDNLVYYTYDNSFLYQQYYYDSLSFYTPEFFKFLADLNTSYLYIHSQGRNPSNPTAWNYLKAYLNAKLSWNSSLDKNQLIDKWFKGVFQDAWKHMKEIFISTRTHYMQTVTAYNMNGKTFTGQMKIENRNYWPRNVLDEWIAAYDEAYGIIERYKLSDPELYEKICFNIELECLSPLIIKAKLYNDELSYEEKTALKNRLAEDVEKLDVGSMIFNEGNVAGTLISFVNSL